MDRLPKVSVIIPSFNHAQYLPQRIESVLNQSFTSFELIILDDCSTDNSQEVINQYVANFSQVSAFFNKENSGSTFFQWQKGLELSKGEYIWIAESDDFAELDFLKKLVTVLESNPSLVLAYCNSTIVDEHNQPLGTTAEWKNASFQTTHWSEDFIVAGQTELDNYLSKTCTINNASSVLFRKKAMLSAGGIDNSYRYTGDWLMYQKMCLQGGISYQAACLSNYREHSNNASKKSNNDSRDLLERQRCFAFVFNKIASLEAKSEMLSIASRELAALTYNLLRRKFKPVLFIKYIRQIRSVDNTYYFQAQWLALTHLTKPYSNP